MKALMTPTGIAAAILRIGFGATLLLIGVSEYLDFPRYQEIMARGLGSFTDFGMVLANVLPGLMIVGGILFIFNLFPEIATLTAGLSLGVIPVVVLAKSMLTGIPLSSVMPTVLNSFLWLILFAVVVKTSYPPCCCKPEKVPAKNVKKKKAK